MFLFWLAVAIVGGKKALEALEIHITPYTTYTPAFIYFFYSFIVSIISICSALCLYEGYNFQGPIQIEISRHWYISYSISRQHGRHA